MTSRNLVILTCTEREQIHGGLQQKKILGRPEKPVVDETHSPMSRH